MRLTKQQIAQIKRLIESNGECSPEDRQCQHCIFDTCHIDYDDTICFLILRYSKTISLDDVEIYNDMAIKHINDLKLKMLLELSE